MIETIYRELPVTIDGLIVEKKDDDFLIIINENASSDLGKVQKELEESCKFWEK